MKYRKLVVIALCIGIACISVALLWNQNSGTLLLDEGDMYISPANLVKYIDSINNDNYLFIEPAETIVASRFSIDTDNFDVYTITPCSPYFSGRIVVALPKNQNLVDVSLLDFHVTWFDRWYVQRQYDEQIAGDRFIAVIDFGNMNIYSDLLMVCADDLSTCKMLIMQLAHKLQFYSALSK